MIDKTKRDALRAKRKQAPDAAKGRWCTVDGWVNAKVSILTTALLGLEDSDARKVARLIVAEHNAIPGLLDDLDSKDQEIARSCLYWGQRGTCNHADGVLYCGKDKDNYVFNEPRFAGMEDNHG